MKLFATLVLIILLIPLAQAKSGHITLLTVTDVEGGKGGSADLYLEVRPGEGAIFIDSVPLTKLDTQISTRYANQIACDFLKKDCNKYDFFYKIRANAGIVGGPSAGAAMTVLTIAVLADLNIDQKIAMTGTINSGGIIGPVAGIDQKIEGAINNGNTIIIIPKWQSSINISNIRNLTDKKITVIKVKNVEEAMFHVTGKSYPQKDGEIAILEAYSNKMNEVAEILCNRSEEILETIDKTNKSSFLSATDYLNYSEIAKKSGDHYSRASYCFSANIRLRELQFNNKSVEEINEALLQTNNLLHTLNNNLKIREIKTLTELETYIIVKERLTETEKILADINESNISISSLAYAHERLFSAIAWSEFFELKGKEIDLNEELLADVCLKKAAEAEERINYAELYLPGFLEQAKEEVDEAYEYYNKKEFPLCIFKASKAKAEANIFLAALYVNDEDLENIINEKFATVKKIINEQNEKGLFPILGYSYFQYSNSLLEHDPISSLTFTEYALEFSRLDLYFPVKENDFKINLNYDKIELFVFGFIVGVAFILLIKIIRQDKSMNNNNKPGRLQEYRNLPGKKR